MEFLNIWAFLLILAIPFLFTKNKVLPFSNSVVDKITKKAAFNNKKRFFVFIGALIFAIFALSRPVIKGEEKNIVTTSTIGIIIDLSQDSLKKDLFPNRFQTYIAKLKELFSNLKGEEVVVIAASKYPLLITPPTNDYDAIIYLLKHISPSSFLNEADFKAAKEAIKEFNPSTIIEIKGKNFIINDKKIPILYSSADIKKLIKETKNKKVTLTNQKELFYYPLAISIILFIIGGL